MSGPDAARLLYDETRFERHTALPGPVKKTLLGEDGVQTLDDAGHKHRKAMFMSFMTPASIASLTECAASGCRRRRHGDSDRIASSSSMNP